MNVVACLGAFSAALPNHGAEECLIGRLVVREANVAIDAVGAVGGGNAMQRVVVLAHEVYELLQLPEPTVAQRIVLLFVFGKPFAAVVVAQFAQELECFGHC